MILTTDWHLTDNPADEYRWDVFKALNALLDAQKSPSHVVILGDLTDRKDKHSAALANRVLREITALRASAYRIDILMGNHDMPLSGTPYWNILNACRRDNLFFHHIPCIDGGFAFLPYSDNPAEAWSQLSWSGVQVILMHQTVAGVVAENGYKAVGSPMPMFPRGIKIYSGDIHTPQVVGRTTYVGAPHPIKFGDDYICRMLILDDWHEIMQEVELSPARKALITFDEDDDPIDAFAHLHPGDQVKLRCRISQAAMAGWPAHEAQLQALAAIAGVNLSSVEALVVAPETAQGQGFDGAGLPHEVLTDFAAKESLDPVLLTLGSQLLAQALSDGG